MFEPHNFSVTPAFILITAIFLIVSATYAWRVRERILAIFFFVVGLLWLTTLFQLLKGA
jgi:hypothetical membrane protein